MTENTIADTTVRADQADHAETTARARDTQLGTHLSLPLALLPLGILIGLLVCALVLFGDGTIGGPAQIALLLSGCIAAAVGVVTGTRWKQLEAAVSTTIARAAMPVMILLAIGSLIGVWMASGTIPTLILLGANVLSPSVFYLAALIVSAVVALVIGSSWTTAATVGVALIGVATASGLSVPMTAGAIISGVYFGDKLSPLSDTTNLASGLAGADLFVHVRYMLWTTVPAFIVAALFFTVMSISAGNTSDAEGLSELLASLGERFDLSWVLLLPFIAIFAMAYMGVPALIAIILATVFGAVLGSVVQGGMQGAESATFASHVMTYWNAAASGFETDTGSELANSLVNRGGMDSMLNTVWLILSAMFFSGMMERSGCLGRLLLAILGLFKRDGAILYGVGATSLATNTLAADQYLSLVLSARMYDDEVRKRGLAPETLSRTMEDFGTVTSPLVPWNTCGAYMAATLGVSTFAYLPFCIFNIVSPFISTFYIASGKTIRWQPGRTDTRSGQPAAA